MGKNRTLLIAEDEPTERDIMTRALQTLDYEVLSAENGRRALELYHEHGADLVLTDIHMPEMSGLELLKALREQGSDIPVILITGFDTTEAQAMADKYRAAALLMKPFRLLQLRDLIGQVLADGGKKQ
jgi:CheY-like chemotaxis protein